MNIDNCENFQNKYRIKSARLQSWNYGWESSYFVTVCTKNRINYFGNINDGKMEKSEIGEIVSEEWLKTANIRPDMNLSLHQFVIMPNHFHAIIHIGKNKYNNYDGNDNRRDAMHCVSTVNEFKPQSKNLSSIMRGFKSAVTKQAHCLGFDFAWQTRFHEHIIRNEKSFNRISQYVIDNPKLWDKDKFWNK